VLLRGEIERSNSAVVALAVVAVVVGTLSVAPAALGAPPANDNFESATLVATLPFADTVSIVEATTEPGEPIDAVWYQGRSVWYSYTPAEDAVVKFETEPWVGSPFMVVYRADGPGLAGLTRISGDHWSTPMSRALSPTGGTTYFVQGGDRYAVWDFTQSFTLRMAVVPPPPNDDFADAIAFSTVPFSDQQDLTAATLEPGEPAACGSLAPHSTWYAFTPSVSGSYGSFGASNLSVYRGTSLGDLTNVACSEWPGLYFYARAGETYYIQRSNPPEWGGGVRIEAIPPPQADFRHTPTDPSMLADTSFEYWIGGYWDPTVNGWDWDFGDGTIASGESVMHRFSSDGDYAVTLRVSARGGRSATVTKTVQVRTHDVSILSFVTPEKGKVGKPGRVTVGVGNTRYAEAVRLDLFKVSPQGDVLVGSRTANVPVMRLQKEVQYAFEYVFTADDAAIEKVPFKVVATIVDARDALPGDNTAVAAPTLVTK
jgi:hypothetical protein